MNLASILSTVVLASSVSVSSAPVERQLLAITPSDFAQRFNTVAQDTGSGPHIPGIYSGTGRMIWEIFPFRDSFRQIERKAFPDHEVPAP